MEAQRLPSKDPPRRSVSEPAKPQREQPAESVAQFHPGWALLVGAKTLAGIGIGLLFVFGGAAFLGIAAETLIVPSLLVKTAGGIAGGGLGLSKGVNDLRKMR